MASPSADEARDALQHLMCSLWTVTEEDLDANKVLAEFINANEPLDEAMQRGVEA